MTAEAHAGRIAGQVAIVTGGVRGIGYGIAEHLAAEGARIVIADLEIDALEQAAQTLRENGAEVLTHAGDLSDRDVVAEMIDKTLAGFGKIEILVNNAGGGIILPFLEHDEETLRTTVDRNLWTAIWCSTAVLPPMLERRYGRIISIGADSVRNGLLDHAAYNAAKGGVHGLTTGLAREFATQGITANVVAPCGVRTHSFDAFQRENPARIKEFVSVIPMERPAEVTEVASMVTYLALPEAGFVTGQVISVNGGSTML